jgi:hypothetical protein
MGAFPRSIGIVVTIVDLRLSCSVFREPARSMTIEFAAAKVAGRIGTPIDTLQESGPIAQLVRAHA